MSIMDLGDRFSGCTISFAYTSVTTTGAPSALSGSPAPFYVVWKQVGAWTCSQAGVTISLDCKGVTGWNAGSVNTNADPAFYSCGADYVVQLIGGTVGGTCVSGYTIAAFSLKNRAALTPLIHGQSLDTVSLTVGAIACTNWNQLKSSYGTCGTFGALLDCRVSMVLHTAMPQPDSVFQWNNATPCTILTYLGAVATNQTVQDNAGVQGLCTRAGTATIARKSVTDTGSAATLGSAT